MTSFEIISTISVLPAKDFKETVLFYKNLGFVNQYENQKRSGGYAILEYAQLTFHLFAYKKLEIPTPTNMLLISTVNIDDLYYSLQEHYKQNTGKQLKRSGYPKISLPRNLNSDRRFTLTDPNGNYFIFVEPHEKKEDISSTLLEKLYRESNTLAYSHESPEEAIKMITRGLNKSDWENENPKVVFESLVLLVDMNTLLGELATSKNYLTQAEKWFEKLSEQDKVGDSILFFEQLKEKLL